MSDDIFSAFGRGFVAFAHTKAADLVGDSFSDSGKLIASLADGQSNTTKPAFEAVKKDVEQLVGIGTALKAAIDKEINDAKAAVKEMADELKADPFEADELARALTALGKLLVAYDNAILKVAEKVSEKAPPGMTAEQIRADIANMNAPIKKVLASGGGAVTGAFDKLCKAVLGMDDASDKLGERLTWDYDNKKLSCELVGVGAGSLPPLNFDGAKLVAFFTYKTEFKAGLSLKTKLKAGLLKPAGGPPAPDGKTAPDNKLLEKILPGKPPTADTEQVAITLDTKKGLTFGDGEDKRLVLPVRFSWPGLELREFALVQPAAENKDGKNRLNVVFTAAGKLGDTFACVIEGGGLTIRWTDGGDPTVEPKIPTGAGLRLKTPAITGGGYLRYSEEQDEYGGVFQLEMLKIGVTAFGLIKPDPFSLVIVIGVRFLPKIELGFGFTLSGLGGILAIGRKLNTDALRDGLKDGVVGKLLFPSDPVAAAPEILNLLGKVFPPQPGGFVIGPIAELGWGSQAGFVKARLGVLIALPDPKLVLLGNVQIGVPSADVEPKDRVIDLRAEIFGEITPEYFFLKVSLANSKLFTLEVTGDIALYVQWAGEGAFALSVGGFFPGYEAPAKIGAMQRVGIKFAPPVKWLSISANAYIAITTNTVQFGGRVEVIAKLGPAKAEAWLQLDALFQWAPHFYFVIRIDAGIKVSAMGVTLAGVSFKGELSGDKPFRLEGRAEAEILWWTIPVDIGPITWGEATPPPAPVTDPFDVLEQALNADAAWTPLLPADAQSIVRLSPAAPMPDAQGVTPKPVPLYHPLGQIELRQISIPLETEIDRIGSSKAARRRVNLAAPSLDGMAAGAVWPLMDRFPPGHFLQLSDDQILSRPEYETHASGLGMGAARGASFTTASHAGLTWDTVRPGGEDKPMPAMKWAFTGYAAKVLGASPKLAAVRAGANPYADAPRPAPVVDLSQRGAAQVLSADTLMPAGPEAGLVLPASAAAEAVRIGRAQGVALTTLAMGMV